VILRDRFSHLRASRFFRFLAVAILAVETGEAGVCSATGAPGAELSAHQNSSSIPGTCHVLKRGQTLYSISRAYRVALDVLATVNEIPDPSRVPAGRVLFIPGASGPLEIPPAAAPLLIWPLTGGVTSPFGSERRREHHEGIDIDGVKGQLVRAAAAGRVVWAGSEQGYGNMVVIDHGAGLSTLYAHADRLLVDPDEWVDSGDPVAEVGSTGNARGAHLHFEVHRNGLPVNPLPLLGSGTDRISAAR